jgi:predicted dehydrogenase
MESGSKGQAQAGKKLKVGVVGTGYAGKVHLNAMKRIDGLKLQSICDASEEMASKTASEYGIPTHYTDIDKMLEQEGLDFISICTPTNTHLPLCLKAIKAGVHVLLEKPFTETSDESQAILDALKEAGGKVKVGVVHQLLFLWVMQQAKEIVNRGEIGKVLKTSIIRAGVFENDSYISNKDHWVHDTPGGRICEALPHQVYLTQEFLGDISLQDVSGRKHHTDAAWVSFDEVQMAFESEAGYATIYWSRNTNINEYLMFIVGADGILEIDLLSGTIMKRLRPAEPERLKQTGLIVADLGQMLSSLGLHYKRKMLQMLGKGSEYFDPYEVCIRSFARSMINGEEPEVNAQKGHDCIRVVEDVARVIDKLRK